jgi:hypothetical protein
MSRNGWIALWSAGICAAFAAGILVGRSEKSRPLSRPPQPAIETRKTQPDKIAILLPAMRDKLRSELAEKQERIVALENEVGELRAKLPPPLTPEEEKKKKEEEELGGMYKRRQARYKGSEELRAKILQRKDKVLRAQALDRVAALLESKDREEVMLGLTVLSHLPGINYDRERYRPALLAALNDEDREVRWNAVNCARMTGIAGPRGQLSLSLANDPFPTIRWLAAEALQWGFGWPPEQKEEAISVLRSLSKDPDPSIRRQAMDGLSRIPECAAEVDDIAIETSRSPDQASGMLGWLSGRDTISATVARRLVEMYEEGGSVERYGDPYYPVEWTHHHLADEAKPIAIDRCFRIIHDSLNPDERRRAVEGLGSIGELSILPQLEEIAGSYDAEGIEKELTIAIGQLQKQVNRER